MKKQIVMTAWKSFEDGKECLSFTNSETYLTEKFLLEWALFKEHTLIAEMPIEVLKKNQKVSDLLKEISQLKKELELCKEQRNQYIHTVVYEFYSGPNSFEEEIKTTIDEDNKKLKEWE